MERSCSEGSRSSWTINGFASSFYILVNFFASSAKHQPEMTKLCVVWRTWTTTANFSVRRCVLYFVRGEPSQFLCRDQRMSRNVQRTHHVAFAFNLFVPLQDAITMTITLKNWIPDNNRHEQETFRSQVHTLDFDWTARQLCMSCTWFFDEIDVVHVIKLCCVHSNLWTATSAWTARDSWHS